MEGRYVSFSKTLRGQDQLDERLENAVNRNIISKVKGFEKKEKVLYRGPNYHFYVEKMENNSNFIQVFSQGSPMNEPYLRKIIGRTLN